MADISGMKFQNSKLDAFYQSALKALPANTIERAAISTPEQSVDSISEQVRAYLDPYYRNATSKRQAQTQQYKTEIDADATSRGMGASTYVTDMKNRQLVAEAADIAALNNEYASTLAQNVAQTYENYLNRKASVDEINADNQIEVDKWNSQVQTALEQLAYTRAMEEYRRAMAASSGGGGTVRRSSGPANPADGIEKTGSGDTGNTPVVDSLAYTRPYSVASAPSISRGTPHLPTDVPAASAILARQMELRRIYGR